MQDEVRELHQQTLEDERDVSGPLPLNTSLVADLPLKYMDLQAQLQMQRASVAAQQMRRHSVAACGLPDASLPPAPFLQAYQSHGAQGQHPQY